MEWAHPEKAGVRKFSTQAQPVVGSVPSTLYLSCPSSASSPLKVSIRPGKPRIAESLGHRVGCWLNGRLVGSLQTFSYLCFSHALRDSGSWVPLPKTSLWSMLSSTKIETRLQLRLFSSGFRLYSPLSPGNSSNNEPRLISCWFSVLFHSFGRRNEIFLPGNLSSTLFPHCLCLSPKNKSA